MEGVIEEVDGTIAVTKIRVKYRIKLPQGQREAAERALEHHKQKCPVAQTLTRGVEIGWDAEFEEE